MIDYHTYFLHYNKDDVILDMKIDSVLDWPEPHVRYKGFSHIYNAKIKKPWSFDYKGQEVMIYPLLKHIDGIINFN